MSKIWGALIKIGKRDLIKGRVLQKKVLHHLFDQIPATYPFYLFFQGFEAIDGADFIITEKGFNKVIFLKCFVYHCSKSGGLEIMMPVFNENRINDIRYSGIPDGDPRFWRQRGDAEFILKI